MQHGHAAAIPTVALALGLAGVLPFWLGLLIYFQAHEAVGSSDGLTLLVGYAAVILGFLGGVRWGAALAPIGRPRRSRDLCLSVLAPLAAAAGLLLPGVLALALLIAAFLLQALWDVVDGERGDLPAWYCRLRLIVTTLAVPALLLALGKAVTVAPA